MRRDAPRGVAGCERASGLAYGSDAGCAGIGMRQDGLGMCAAQMRCHDPRTSAPAVLVYIWTRHESVEMQRLGGARVFTKQVGGSRCSEQRASCPRAGSNLFIRVDPLPSTTPLWSGRGTCRHFDSARLQVAHQLRALPQASHRARPFQPVAAMASHLPHRLRCASARRRLGSVWRSGLLTAGACAMQRCSV